MSHGTGDAARVCCHRCVRSIGRKARLLCFFSKDRFSAVDRSFDDQGMPCAFSQRSVVMLSLSSIHTVSQSPLWSASLVADAVRPSSPLKAIEPTTAVSKERSRAENKAPDAGTNAQLAAAARAAAVSQQAAVQSTQTGTEGGSQRQSQTTGLQADQPLFERRRSRKHSIPKSKVCCPTSGKPVPKRLIFCLGAMPLSNRRKRRRRPANFKPIFGRS